MASSSSSTKTEKKSIEYLRVRLDDSLIPTLAVTSKEKKDAEKISEWAKEGCRFRAVDQIEGDGDEFLSENRTGNYLFNAFIYAYNNHCPLVLRADDILLAIAMTVTKFIDLDPAAVRNIFLAGEQKSEKEKLNVHLEEENWPKFLQLMENAIKGKVTTQGKVILDAITNDFSTTTAVSRSVSQIQIMSAMKNYFSYGFEMGCGMSEVMMLGSIEDWNNLGAKYRALKTAIPQLSWWYRWMDIIIDMFVGMRKLGTYGSHTLPSSNSSHSLLSGNEKEEDNKKGGCLSRCRSKMRNITAASNTFSAGGYGGSVPPKNVPAEYKEIWKRVVSYCPQGSGGQTHLGGWLHMLAPYATNGKTIVDSETEVYSPLMPSVAAPKETKGFQGYDHQDTVHKFYKGRKWAEVPQSISTVNATTDFMGNILIQSGFCGVVCHTIPGLSITGVRPVCAYRISADKVEKKTETVKSVINDEDSKNADEDSGDEESE